MRKLLLFFTFVLTALGVKAATISGDGISGATDNSSGHKVQTLVVSTPGALAAWVAAHTGDNYGTNNPFEGFGGSDDFYSLNISGELNAADLAALNSSTCAAFSRFPRIDMSGVTLADGVTSADVCGVNFGTGSFDKNGTTITGAGAEYILLPNGTTEADDVTLMSSMKESGKNSNLKMVGSYDNTTSTWPELALQSFQANEVSNFLNSFTGQNMAGAKEIRMSGTYGDRDLSTDGANGKVFTGSPGAWDFTGASFADITVNPGVNDSYYGVDDPFCLSAKSKPGANYSTNAFFYFSIYASDVAKIDLPTGITSLPPHCLYQLGNTNKSNYIALYGQAAYDSHSSLVSASGACMDELVIPDNIEVIDYECGVRPLVKNFYFGSGLKEIRGGAFNTCKDTESVDFKAGTTNCRLGDRAFQEAYSMKHIVLSEGITSIGAYCFQNSQQMESIRLPETLLYIGDLAFENNLALSSITIPENVQKIGKKAFQLCPLTDVFLTTTDPDQVPEIWTAGNNWGDLNSTFGANAMYGNNGIPYNAAQFTNWDADATASGANVNITWDDAVQLYYAKASCMAVLHYPDELAEKLLASLSASYGAISSDGYGLPVKNPVGEYTEANSDAKKRASGNNGERYMGKADEGIYTSDGWAQFLLMRAFHPDKPIVYTKEYDDVWYTMCFPFDLSDEQLATAFNEGFNIVDFSGVEIQQPEENEEEKLTLILHFNTVAKTVYKDADGLIYTLAGTKTTHGKFTYNDYIGPDGNTYKHVQMQGDASNFKTKVFAIDGNSSNGVVMIDGVLAEAGHPYMVHPNTGANSGMPLVRCHFSGIKWEDESTWASLYDARKREIDLGEQKGNPATSTPDADNYMQAAYGDYANQTYTFKGNYQQYKDDPNAPAYPTVDNGQLTAMPEVTAYTDLYPRGPQMPADRQAVVEAVGERMTVAPTAVPNPDEDATYSSDFKTLFSTVRCTWYEYPNNYSFTYGDDLVSFDADEFFDNNLNYRSQSVNHTSYGNRQNIQNLETLKNYLGQTITTLDGFNQLKALAEQYGSAKEAYDKYVADNAAYQANQTAWNEYLSTHQSEEDDYQTAMTTYLTAVGNWQAACATVKRNNDGVIAQWESDMIPYQTLIPTGAYFLGRQGRGWPKYYREIADDTRENPTGGFWTQYTAVIIPNAAAKAGIEAEIDGTGSQGVNQSVEMVFDEGFLGEEKTSTEIEQIITEAEAEGQKVEYMQVVYNINGQIVREGTELTGLPKGIYIVNGKKYFVR